MLADRIEILYRLLQCNNTEIARFAGCTSGNISRLKSGSRCPAPRSRTITLFVNGIYGYADYENMLESLREMCGAADASRESIVPALTAWLYETDRANLPQKMPVPRSRKEKETRRKNFGTRLNQAMNLLELTNSQLAALLNIDDSLVSRYRSGVYSPYGNLPLLEKLSGALIARAEKLKKTAELEKLCGAACPDEEALSAWLFDTSEDDPSAMAQMLLQSLDGFTSQAEPPSADRDELSAAARSGLPAAMAERYWGTEGLREAVTRFLSETLQEGGELLLFSDEPMGWMTGEKKYFARWAAMMTACVRQGVRIKIVHNLDRYLPEMVEAIRGWYPLYASGMIEPYVFQKERNPRFCHTGFLRKGAACILGHYVAGSGQNRWYDYITDPERLAAMEEEFRAMLSASSPYLRTYTQEMGADFRAFRMKKKGTRSYLLNSFPVFTMPGELLSRMLGRTDLEQEEREALVKAYGERRNLFREMLKSEQVNVLICPQAEKRTVNFALDLIDLPLEYTREEYAEHLEAIAELVKSEKNFHLSLLPEAMFQDTQLIAMSDAVAATRCLKPLTAFMFMNPILTASVTAFLEKLMGEYAMDRSAILNWIQLTAGKE